MTDVVDVARSRIDGKRSVVVVVIRIVVVVVN